MIMVINDGQIFGEAVVEVLGRRGVKQKVLIKKRLLHNILFYSRNRFSLAGGVFVNVKCRFKV